MGDVQDRKFRPYNVDRKPPAVKSPCEKKNKENRVSIGKMSVKGGK